MLQHPISSLPARSATSCITAVDKVETICGWPTKTLELDFSSGESCVRDDTTIPAHTLIVFIPGNPGLLEWYKRSLTEILLQLGPGYMVRGVANAGHAIENHLVRPRNAKPSVAWTLQGQIRHKQEYVRQLMQSFPTQDIVFISHSIGAYFVQELCVDSPDILQRTTLLLQLTPFLQMNAPWLKQTAFDYLAARPESTIRMHEPLMQFLKSLPAGVVDRMLSFTMGDESSRGVTVDLLRQPLFCENFFQLGLREIREVPRKFDVRIEQSVE